MAESTISKKESLALLATSLIVAASVLLVTVIVARVLSPEEASDFIVFWGMLFGVYGVLSGIQQEITRAVGNGRSTSRQGAKVMPIALGFGTVAAVLVLLLGAAGGDELITHRTTFAFLIVAAGAVLYSGQSAMMGASSGQKSWYTYASISSGDAILRLMMVVGVIFFASLQLFELASMLSVVIWILLLATRHGRRAFSARADVPGSQLARNMLFAVVSSSANAVLITGFPVLLKLAVGSESDASTTGMLAAVVFAISITRSPIMIPLQAFQGVAITAFLAHRDHPVAAIRKPLIILLGIGAAGGLLAWWLGPWLFTLVFGNKYDGLLSGSFLGALTFASAFMALLTLTGALTLAIEKHTLFTTGWIIAALVAILLAFVPVPIETKTLLALYGGPVAGVMVHLRGLTK